MQGPKLLFSGIIKVIMLLKVLTYNPLKIYPDRLCDILQEFNTYHALALNSTGYKAGNKSMETWECGKFKVFAWGWKKGKHSNKSCGVHLCLNTSLFAQQYFNAVYSPPTKLAGRGGAVRYILPFLDICFITWYAAPNPNSTIDRETNVMLCEWLSRVIGKLPKRCFVVFSCDCNGHVGITEEQMECMPAIGDYDQAKENFHGKVFRQLLQDTGMVAVNTHFPVGDTYYGDNTSTRVDYIGIKEAHFPDVVEECFIPEAKADRLQHIRIQGKRDHRPIALWIRHQLQYSKSPLGPSSAFPRHVDACYQKSPPHPNICLAGC